mmetsp:Transcript_98822/g.285215  ORF Transcript_98822/g.285215 Transcript_98822/m.285215 type:complete len:240 (-) Transcript_98822:1574-2293(-)
MAESAPNSVWTCPGDGGRCSSSCCSRGCRQRPGQAPASSPAINSSNSAIAAAAAAAGAGADDPGHPNEDRCGRASGAEASARSSAATADSRSRCCKCCALSASGPWSKKSASRTSAPITRATTLFPGGATAEAGADDGIEALGNTLPLQDAVAAVADSEGRRSSCEAPREPRFCVMPSPGENGRASRSNNAVSYARFDASSPMASKASLKRLNCLAHLSRWSRGKCWFLSGCHFRTRSR